MDLRMKIKTRDEKIKELEARLHSSMLNASVRLQSCAHEHEFVEIVDTVA